MRIRQDYAPSTGNPIIRHKYTTDPTALVHDDTVYLYTGHDEAPVGMEEYVMNDWLCFSSTDMANWTEHSVPLKSADFNWAKDGAYAPKVLERDGKFYFYAPVTHASIPGRAIGVAVSDNPIGPFRDAKGSALITGEMTNATEEFVNIDPTVHIDDDGQTHIFWGKYQCYYAKLKSNMIELDGEIKTVEFPNFEEGSHLHKRGDWYYFSYGYGSPEKVAYSMSRNIEGPWEFKGILNELAGNCETNRPAIVDFKGKSYFFYHNGALKNGGSHRRSVCVDYLYYNADGTMKRVIMTSEGVKAVK
ncbi:MAG: glycoside hydrolase [Anaerolineaceae bacterium]|nr:MAG: glycoside hydrolase [Anaerolineaceae bacterium]